MNSAKRNAKSIFLEAIEKYAPDQWESFVAEAVADDAELGRKVHVLLGAHQENDRFFDHADRTVGQSPLTETAGTVIGPYKLREQIGEGGMGVVFVAERSQPYRQKVALKIVKPGMDTKEIIARFEKAADRLIITFVDDGAPFNPLERDAPSKPSSIEDQTPGGLGIHLVRKLSDEVTYHHHENRNVLTTFLRLNRKDSSATEI